MKTLRDTNNNNSNTTSNTTQQHFATTTRHNCITSNGLIHQNSTVADSDVASYSALLTQNRLQQQTIWQNNNDQPSLNSHTQQVTSSKQTTQNINPNPLTSMFNGDPNQFFSIIQSYLTKFGGNQLFQSETINPLFYLQLLNANTIFMQQLSAIQNNTLSSETINSGKNSQFLPNDSNIFVPKTRPMTQDEIAEHARLVYHRALQRNQLQQHHDLMKHFYETLNIKQHDSSNTINHNEVPTVPNSSNITSVGTYDVLDTMITSPSSCVSVKELGVNAAMSAVSLLSVDDTKMISNTSSILDPGAPIFIPRQKLDDENETSSSSSDSDLNDFHYLDQFLEEFYHSNNEDDNHLIIQKSLSSNTANIGDEISNNNNKYPVNPNILGQGDAIEKLSSETINESIEQPLPTTNEKQERQYSIYELLNRYRNPRCHLVLPEWSRLSLILPNVCSMRGHTYKLKRYFAYRRRLSDDQDLPNLPVQG